MSENYIRKLWEAVQNDSGEWEIWFTYGDKDQFSSFNVIGIEAESDARLIAAAPKMLEALKGLLAEYEDQRDQFGNDPLWQKHSDIEAVEEARRAIHEAGGEE